MAILLQTPTGNSVKAIDLNTITSFNKLPGGNISRFRDTGGSSIDLNDPAGVLNDAAAALNTEVVTATNSNLTGTDPISFVVKNIKTAETTGGTNLSITSVGEETIVVADSNNDLLNAILALKVN